MPPSDLDDLQPAEQMLLLACRRALGGHGDDAVRMAWRLGCGDERGGATARAFEDMTLVLRARARRPLRLRDPGTPALGMDERGLLELVAACQWGACALAVALARWLVHAPDHVGLLGTAAAVARTMEVAGLKLRAPSTFRADRGPWAPGAA